MTLLRNFLVPVAAALSLAVASVQAAMLPVIYDFADGKTDGWYTSRASADLTATTANGGSMTSLVGSTTTQVLTHFTPDDAYVLEVGEAFQVTIKFSLTDVAATGSSLLRVGLFDSLGSRLTSDGLTTVHATFNKYDGYALFGSRSGGWRSYAKRTGNSNALLVDGGPWTSLGTFPDSVEPFVSASDYTVVFRVLRTDANSVTLSSSWERNGEIIEYMEVIDNSGFIAFDTLAIAMGSNLAQSITLNSVEIAVIPEPSTTAFLGGGALLLAGGLSLRRRKGAMATLLAFSAGPALLAAPLNVKDDFGAVGDGKADDTEALQRAFSSGKEVYLPLGDYRFTSTLRASPRTKLRGESGSWNAKGQSTLVYDGESTSIAVRVEEAHHFQIRHLTIDAGEKADVGVYWCYSINDAMMEDSSIRGSRRHGLYITKTWYAHFNRLHVRRNLGAGVTLDRSEDAELAKGAVNYVNFNQCIFHSNGTESDYDGESRVATGYGVGLLGANSVINFTACAMERNGGAGVYLNGPATNVTFTGCYIEHNSAALYRALEKVYGEGFKWRTIKDRKPTGRMASIIDETTDGRGPILFEQCYVNPQNGVWLKGPGGRFPLVFRGLWHPIVYWSENANWVAYDSSWAPFSSRPGIIYRPAAGDLATTSRFEFHDPEKGVSGHPAYSVRQGVRKLVPAPRQGLDLYINTAETNSLYDGRSEQRPFSSLQKALALINDTQLDTEIRLHVKGNVDEALSLQSVRGAGRLVLTFAEDSRIAQPWNIDGVSVAVQIENGFWQSPVTARQSQVLTIRNARFAPINQGEAIVLENTAARLDACSAEGKPLVRADWLSKVSFTSSGVEHAFELAQQ